MTTAGGNPYNNVGPTDVANLHRQSDVNSSTLAQHHTLGIQPNMASPGDHTHNGVDSPVLAAGSHSHPEIVGVPVGTITMFGGGAAPSGWLLCQGQSLSRVGTYAGLFGVIGTAYGAVDAASFSLPDMRNKFPVGSGSSYGLNAQGGADTVTLTSTQMPSHNHSSSGSADYQGSHSHSLSGSYSDSQGYHGHSGGTYGSGSHQHVQNAASTIVTTDSGSGVTAQNDGTSWTQSAGDHSHSMYIDGNGTHSHNVYGSTDYLGSHSHNISVTVNNTGGGTAHENRPPYIGINFIIKY